MRRHGTRRNGAQPPPLHPDGHAQAHVAHIVRLQHLPFGRRATRTKDQDTELRRVPRLQHGIRRRGARILRGAMHGRKPLDRGDRPAADQSDGDARGPYRPRPRPTRGIRPVPRDGEAPRRGGRHRRRPGTLRTGLRGARQAAQGGCARSGPHPHDAALGGRHPHPAATAARIRTARRPLHARRHGHRGRNQRRPRPADTDGQPRGGRPAGRQLRPGERKFLQQGTCSRHDADCRTALRPRRGIRHGPHRLVRPALLPPPELHLLRGGRR